MNNENKELNSKLKDIIKIFEGKIDEDEIKNYILGFLFFRFLSEKEEDILEKKGIDIKEINSFSNDELEILKDTVIESIGYYFNPKYLFSKIIKDTKKGNPNNIIAFLEKAVIEINDSTIGKESNANFKELFKDINLKNHKLGSDDWEIANLLSNNLEKIAELSITDTTLKEIIKERIELANKVVVYNETILEEIELAYAPHANHGIEKLDTLYHEAKTKFETNLELSLKIRNNLKDIEVSFN